MLSNRSVRFGLVIIGTSLVATWCSAAILQGAPGARHGPAVAVPRMAAGEREDRSGGLSELQGDTDGDGLDDDWELQYFGNLDQGAEDDAEFDGMTNLQEYQLGTIPIDGDTDDDECFDGDEVDVGLDPLDNSDCDGSVWPIFYLDVGSEEDDESNQPIYLDEGAGLSEPLPPGDPWYRTLDENATLCFHVNTSSLNLDEYGVPFQHAIIDIDYQDVVDEDNCSYTAGNFVLCRPRVATLLNYGENPPLEWQSLNAFAGLDDDTWKQSNTFVEATPWQTLRSINGFLEFRIQYPNQLAGGDPLPIDAITVRFIGDSRFHSQREEDRGLRTFDRRDYEEENTLDPQQYPDGYVLYSRHYLEKIYRNTVPDVAELDPSLETFEVVGLNEGQSEPVAFAIYAFDDLTDVQVTAEALECGQATIPVENIHVCTVVQADRRWRWAYGAEYGLQPWYLDRIPAGGLDIPAGTSQQFWITIDVPAGTAEGTYAGDLTVSINDGRQQAVELVPLAITVFNVELELPDATPHLCHSPYRSNKWFAQDRTLASENQAAHNCYPAIAVDAQIDPGPPLSIDYRDLADELDEFDQLGILPDEPRIGVYDNRGSVWNQLCPGQTYCEGECSAFDDLYVQVLEAYAQFFQQWSVTPKLFFVDEPGIDPNKRRQVNRLNKLAHEAGLKTHVTYYPSCEKPLAGYTLKFKDLTGGITAPNTPGWLTSDPNVSAWWSFTSGTQDDSGNGHTGTLEGGAEVAGGTLNLSGEGEYMSVPHHADLSYEDECTIFFWFKPTQCTTTALRKPVEKKDPYTSSANYVFKFYGDNGGANPENLGLIKYGASGIAGDASGSTKLDCGPSMDDWYNITWVWDGDVGGTMYVNGMPYPLSKSGTLNTNSGPVDLGKFIGSMDDIVLLNRALTSNEVINLAQFLNDSYNRYQTITLTLRVPAAADPPTRMTFSINDGVPTLSAFETLKRLTVHEVGDPDPPTVVWAATALDYPYQLVEIDLQGYVLPNRTYDVEFSVGSQYSREEELLLYFLEQPWRTCDWTVVKSDNWSESCEPDDDGLLGPMDPWLDERTYFVGYVTEEEVRRTQAAGDTFSYYTTYLATQDVILNNRFLNGVYPSAFEAAVEGLDLGGVLVYAYGDWGVQPWDDCEPQPNHRMSTDAGQRAQGGYQLTMPSWEDRIYETLIYESLREGIEDSRIIATLKAAIAGHGGYVADEAEAWLENEVFAGLSKDFMPRYWNTADLSPIEKYADRSEEILTDLLGDPTDFAGVDRIRRVMIEYILTLSDPHLPAIDCNSNGLEDEFDIATGISQDCNNNDIPDECDIAEATSVDCNTNGVPDECKLADDPCEDRNGNGTLDECETSSGWCLGDMNCSGGPPDFADIQYFNTALGCESCWLQYYRDNHGGQDPPAGCVWLLGDYDCPRNGDGVEFGDITPFVNNISSQKCFEYYP